MKSRKNALVSLGYPKDLQLELKRHLSEPSRPDLRDVALRDLREGT